MKKWCLKISSKNKKSLKKFSIFFFKHLKTKFNTIQKPIVGRKKRKTITLLKSPHVNKTAQEHFEMRTFSEQIAINSFYQHKHLIFLKRIVNKLFQDVSISLEFLNNLNIENKNRLLAFYPDNFKLFRRNLTRQNFRRAKQKIISKKNKITFNPLIKLLNFLRITSIFGEIFTVPYYK